MKRYVFLLLVCFSANCYSQSFNEEQYMKQMLQKAEKLSADMRKEWQRTSQFASRPNKKDVYALYINGNKAAYFADEFGCNGQIRVFKIKMESLFSETISNLPNDSKYNRLKAEYRSKGKQYINNINCTCRRENNPNYQASGGDGTNPPINPPTGTTTDGGTQSIFPTNGTTQFGNILTAPNGRTYPYTTTATTETATPTIQPSIPLNWGKMEDYVNNGIDPNATPRIFEQPYAPKMDRENTMEAEMREHERIAAEREEREKAYRFNVDSMKSRKDKLAAEYDELLTNCIKYNIKSDCIGQFKPIRDEIDVMNNRIAGREEWLDKVKAMKDAGSLDAQERNYKKLAEMAGMAEYSYEEKQGKPEGWEPDKKYANIIDEANNNNDGFHCELLYNEKTGKYVLSFRGTNDWGLKKEGDLDNNVHGNFSKNDAQTKLAIKVTGDIITELEKQGIPSEKLKEQLQLTGHSLGGRLAAEAAIEKNLIAYTFDAADISRTTRDKIGINNNVNILNTVSANDPITARGVGLGNSEGGINQQSYIKPPKIRTNEYFSGNTNVIKEVYGRKEGLKDHILGVSSEAHDMSYLRQAIELRHQDILNSLF